MPEISALNTHFIALIHHIQWTIVNPDGADRPVKCQKKKTSCVSTSWPVSVLCTRQVAHRTSFLSRQCDVIASFLFGACSVHSEFYLIKFLVVYCQDFVNLSNIVTSTYIRENIHQHVLTWTKEGQFCPCCGKS